MRKKTLVLSLLLACATAFGQSSYDLVIVGGNPGGIMAHRSNRQPRSCPRTAGHADDTGCTGPFDPFICRST